MYNRIERDFKVKSNYHKAQISYIIVFLVMLALICIAIFGLLFQFNTPASVDAFINEFGYMLLIEVIALIIFYLLIYIYMIIKTRKNENFSFIIALSDHKAIIDLFWEQIYQEDIQILIKILKENSINTRPKVLEAVKHYQTLIPVKLENSIQILSVLALAISIVAFIFDDKIFYSMENLAIAFIFIILITILYLAFCSYNNKLIKMFGKSELYRRLELSLSEIYMRSLIK